MVQEARRRETTQRKSLIASSNFTAKFLMSGVRVMVFNATFNNISVISWQSVLLVEYLIASAKKN